MYLSKVRPTGVERVMKAEDVIISKTDLRGVITYCNDIFVDYSAYSEDQLYGAPHSVIRHPDMPRAVFKLLWQELQAGREIFAFVKNLAHDGRHYWVFAQVIPEVSKGQVIGYFSFRRCPSRRAVTTMEALYKKMRAEEEKVGGNAGMDAAFKMLLDALKGMGKTYEELVFELQGA